MNKNNENFKDENQIINKIDEKPTDCDLARGGVISENENERIENNANIDKEGEVLQNNILENAPQEKILGNINIDNENKNEVIYGHGVQSAPIMPIPLKKRIGEKPAILIVCASLIISILYSICFSGIYIYPQASFTLFCLCTFAVLAFVLHKLDLIKNKKAFAYFIPICIIASFNGIFHLNAFTYFNVMAMHVLFGIFVIRACGKRKHDFLNLGLILNSLMIILGNWIVFPNIIESALPDNKSSKTTTTICKILLGLLLTAPVFLLILFLLMNADTVFNNLVYDIVDNFFDFSFWGILTAIIVFIYMAGYFYNVYKTGESNPKENVPVKIDSIIGSTFLVCINLLFLVFTIVQFAFLWGGGIMALPEGVIYSEYAREGFFQLLFVTFINFSVLIFFKIIAVDSSKNKVIKFLLFMLCAFTGVLIISSFYRMNLYIDTYGYTKLRLCVITFLVMEVFLIISTILALFNKKLNMGNCYFYIGLIFFIVANVSTSDYYTTKLNIDRFYANPTATIDFFIIGKDGFGQFIDVFKSEEYENGEIVISGSHLFHSSDTEKANEVGEIYEPGKFKEWDHSEYPSSSFQAFVQTNLEYIKDEENHQWQNKSLIKGLVYKNNQDIIDKAIDEYFED